METRAPTPGRIAVMVLFALSCFGLLLYLWTAFGGPTPLKPRGYHFYATFDEATQLAVQADVRISGVSVGKVVKTQTGNDGRTRAEIALEDKHAPLPRDARAILRLKTLLGETYVELTPGSAGVPTLPERGTLARANVASTVELDEVLRTFDERTRAQLKTWVTSWSRSLRGRGQDLSDALGNLPGAAEDTTSVLRVLNTQEAAVSRLVHDSGVVFSAVGRDENAVRTLITAGDRVLATTARRDGDITDTLQILPTTLRELRPTLAVAEATAAEAAPVIRALRPVAPLLRPTLASLDALAPDARALFRDLDPLIAVSRTGLPAATRLVRAVEPLVEVLHPIARDLAPVADYLGIYRNEVVTMFANVAAAAEASFTAPGSGRSVRYLRVLIPITQEAFVNQAQRLPSNRHNPYLAPRGLDRLEAGLLAFDCENLSNPQTVPVLGTGAPPCLVQPPFTFRGRTGSFPRLERDAP